MLKSLKKRMKDQAGLTLIELLVVIVILGIIAAVAIPMVTSQRDNAEINTNKQTISILKDAINRYEAIEGIKPADIAALTANKKYLDSAPSCVKSTQSITVANGVITSTCTGAILP
jgi:prepilin-type N-terminal cleavage/methylation domain-containing protein